MFSSILHSGCPQTRNPFSKESGFLRLCSLHVRSRLPTFSPAVLVFAFPRSQTV